MILSEVAIGILLIVLLVRYFGKKPNALQAKKSMLPIGKILLWFVLSRAGLYLAGLLFAHAADVSRWVRWDAPHYISLAENGYVNEGDARFHIVFWPLYPMVVRYVKLLLHIDYTTSAFVVSNGCLLGALVLLYRVAESDWGDKAALRAVRYLCLNPASIFLSTPYGESLFLLLTLAAILCARRKHFELAILFGILCAMTRMPGVLVAIPVYYEMYHDARNWKEKLLRALSCCFMLSGVAVYLIMNKVVTGDFFTFMVYQKEHWYQEFGSLHNTLSYTFSNAISYSDMGYRLTTWIPQLVSIAILFVFLCVAAKKCRAGDAAYFLVYFYVTVAPTWLLSGMRYLFTLYALYPLLASLTDKKWKDALATGLLGASSLYIVWAYQVLGTVM